MVFDGHLRQRVLFVFDQLSIAGMSKEDAIKKASNQFFVGHSTVRDWITLRTVTGSIVPKRTRDGTNNIMMPEEHISYLLHYLDYVDCQLYHSEMCEKLKTEFDVTYTEDQVRAALDRKNYSRKVVERIALEQDDEERMTFRHLVRSQEFGGDFNAAMFVFADETHCNIAQARRRYGYSRKGLPAFRPAWRTHGHDESFSAICTLGIKGIRTVTPHVGGVNTEVFMETLIHVILPSMGKIGEPFSVLVLDNASIHDKYAIIAAVQAHGSLVIFLPPYSYDYNPIEYLFHVAKTYLRRVYHFDDVRKPLIPQFVTALFDCCSAEMAINLFTHAQIHVPQHIRAWAME